MRMIEKMGNADRYKVNRRGSLILSHTNETRIKQSTSRKIRYLENSHSAPRKRRQSSKCPSQAESGNLPANITNNNKS